MKNPNDLTEDDITTVITIIGLIIVLIFIIYTAYSQYWIRQRCYANWWEPTRIWCVDRSLFR